MQPTEEIRKLTTSEINSSVETKECKDIGSQNEVWKDIDGFDSKYSISNLGRVRINYRVIKNQFGYREIRKVEKYMKPCLDKRGYYTVNLRSEGKNLHTWLHRLIAKAFILNPKDLPEINHKNGITGDYRIENLEWIDRKGNIKHAWDNGLCKNSVHIGEKHPRCKITEEIVLEIRKSVNDFKDNTIKYSLADKYKVNITTVNDILRRRSWTHI